MFFRVHVDACLINLYRVIVIWNNLCNHWSHLRWKPGQLSIPWHIHDFKNLDFLQGVNPLLAVESWLVFVARGWLAVLLGRTQENWVFMHRILLHIVLERAQFIFAIWKEVTVFCGVEKLVHHYGNILPRFENLHFFCVAIFDLAVCFFNWNEIANFTATTSAWRLLQVFLLTHTRCLDHISLIIFDSMVEFVRLAFNSRTQL